MTNTAVDRLAGRLKNVPSGTALSFPRASRGPAQVVRRVTVPDSARSGAGSDVTADQ